MIVFRWRPWGSTNHGKGVTWTSKVADIKLTSWKRLSSLTRTTPIDWWCSPTGKPIDKQSHFAIHKGLRQTKTRMHETASAEVISQCGAEPRFCHHALQLSSRSRDRKISIDSLMNWLHFHSNWWIKKNVPHVGWIGCFTFTAKQRRKKRASVGRQS